MKPSNKKAAPKTPKRETPARNDWSAFDALTDAEVLAAPAAIRMRSRSATLSSPG